MRPRVGIRIGWLAALVLCGCGGSGSADERTSSPQAIPTGALNAGLRVSLTPHAVGRVVTFTVQVDDDDGTRPTYTIDFGDGQSAKGEGDAGQPACGDNSRKASTPVSWTVSVKHTYKDAGSYATEIDVVTGSGCTLPAPEERTALALATVA
ncbi:MAG: hypothetical protein QOJ92_2678 [Frankiales bacterium]|nr:hypothetical protein [Frankiales bacterium]